MFCIAAFIVLVIIGVFSAKYRRLLKKSWGCVARKLTLRPCDTTFKNELKSRMLARVAVRRPQYLKAANIGIEVGAFLKVLLTVLSLYVAVKSGLNLYVYGTCNPSNAASCSLGSEACSIETVKPSFVDSAKDLQLHTWFADEFRGFAETVTNIPTRMQTWMAEEYVPTQASYEKPFDARKPTAVEIIDPGCQFCGQLYKNQKTAALSDRYNVTYIAYPIQDTRTPSGYKFPNSLLVTQYLEAIKLSPLSNEKEAVDWKILDRIFTGTDRQGMNYQVKINMLLTSTETEKLLQEWLQEFGYDADEIRVIARESRSEGVRKQIEANKIIVDDRVKTVKIPTIIFDGRRHSGVVDIDQLR